ncbi:hypothetical protein GQ54DRAFT_295867 [Martensiomyces pterosporus]|nr:hypothetical protein GQ54DRAFT_295867 [Martensiomyces pterosporus]
MAATLGVLLLTYLLGILTLPALLAAAVAVLWALSPTQEAGSPTIFDAPSVMEAQEQLDTLSCKRQRSSSSDTTLGPEEDTAAPNNREVASSPYGGRHTGWLRITRTLGQPPRDPPADSGSKLTDIVARGFTKWMHGRRQANGARKTDTHVKSASTAADAPTDTYYAVLDKETLVMYDSERMTECRGVIIMPKHQVSLYHRENVTESQVYSRRTPIRLAPREGDAGDRRQAAEYYVFVDGAAEKEDWYFALLWSSLSDFDSFNGGGCGDLVDDGAAPADSRTAEETGGDAGEQTSDEAKTAPEKARKKTREQCEHLRLRMRRACLVPDHAGISSILHNVSGRSGGSENPGVREDEWLNAVLGRMFLGVYQTEWARQHFIRKMQVKFDRVQKPAFLDAIKVTDLDIGDNFPVITNPKLESFSQSGQVDASMYVHYKGGFRLVLTTGVKLGSIRMSIALSVVLESLAGKMLIRFKPAPSNRVWMGFFEMPSIKLTLKPVFMQKQVKYGAISHAIEKQIYDIIRLTLVLPNLDDTVFFPTDFEDGGVLERYLKEYKDLGLDDGALEEPPSHSESVSAALEANVAAGSTGDSDGLLIGGLHGEMAAISRDLHNGSRPSSLVCAEPAADLASGSASMHSDSDQPTAEGALSMPVLQQPMHTPNTLHGGSSHTSLNSLHQRARSSVSSNPENKRSPSPAPSAGSANRSAATLAKAVSLKSAISTSAVSLFKRAKDSQAAESAKVWWQNMQHNRTTSESEEHAQPAAGGDRHSWHTPQPLGPLGSKHVAEAESDDGGSEYAHQQAPARAVSPVVSLGRSTHAGMGIGTGTLKHIGERDEGYELPLPQLHTPSAATGHHHAVATGGAEGGGFQFPRLADGGSSKAATALGSDAADGGGIRRRVVASAAAVELPIQRRYSKGSSNAATSTADSAYS